MTKLRISVIHTPSGSARGNVHVDNLNMTIESDVTVRIDLKVASSIPKNITILISTNRFTKVYFTNLMTGTNKVTLEYPYVTDSSGSNAGGPYWLYLSQARVIIIDGDMIHSFFVTPIDTNLINLLLFMTTFSILIVYLIVARVAKKGNKTTCSYD